MDVAIVVLRTVALCFIVGSLGLFAYGLWFVCTKPYYLKQNSRNDFRSVIVFSVIWLTVVTCLCTKTYDGTTLGLLISILATLFAAYIFAINYCSTEYGSSGWEVYVNPLTDKYSERKLTGLAIISRGHHYVTDTVIQSGNLRCSNGHLVRFSFRVKPLSTQLGAAEFVRQFRNFRTVFEKLLEVHNIIAEIERITDRQARSRPLLYELQALGKSLGLQVHFDNEITTL